MHTRSAFLMHSAVQSLTTAGMATEYQVLKSTLSWIKRGTSACASMLTLPYKHSYLRPEAAPVAEFCPRISVQDDLIKLIQGCQIA